MPGFLKRPPPGGFDPLNMLGFEALTVFIATPLLGWKSGFLDGPTFGVILLASPDGEIPPSSCC